jgi:hypothetical protein
MWTHREVSHSVVLSKLTGRIFQRVKLVFLELEIDALRTNLERAFQPLRIEGAKVRLEYL